MIRVKWLRLGVALAPLCATPVWAANPDNGPGCGLGKLAWSDYRNQKNIAPQVMMATTGDIRLHERRHDHGRGEGECLRGC